MMIKVNGYATLAPTEKLEPYVFERESPGLNDVLIDILYCGICHADIHQAKNEYGATVYPLVPGHEIVGRIKEVGLNVKEFEVGQLVGVGYYIGSCQHCSSCLADEEQFCENGILPTQNGHLPDGTTTRGGYSNCIVVNKDYVLKVAENLNTAAVAPLLCAGITAYSSLKHYGIGQRHQVAILGLGGVGHLAIKFAVAFGADVTVLSSSNRKEESALALGAEHFFVTSDKAALKSVAKSFDFIIDTVSAQHDYDQYLNLLKKDGTLILLGRPPETPKFDPFSLIARRRKIGGSFTGGMKETQEMLDFCAVKNIVAEIELIRPEHINDAFKRVLMGDVNYRFVIGMTK